MKYKCKWCDCEIEITQSDKAKTGMKKLYDHEAECFKKTFTAKHPNFVPTLEKICIQKRPKEIPNKFDMNGIIRYLHESMGFIPNENQCLRFNMYLQNDPTPKECEDFVIILKKLQ